jgi:hypothetical protein
MHTLRTPLEWCFPMRRDGEPRGYIGASLRNWLRDERCVSDGIIAHCA